MPGETYMYSVYTHSWSRLRVTSSSDLSFEEPLHRPFLCLSDAAKNLRIIPEISQRNFQSVHVYDRKTFLTPSIWFTLTKSLFENCRYWVHFLYQYYFNYKFRNPGKEWILNWNSQKNYEGMNNISSSNDCTFIFNIDTIMIVQTFWIPMFLNIYIFPSIILP